MKKKKKTTNIILNVLIFVLVGVALFSGYKLISTLNEYKKGRQEYDDIREQMIIEPTDQPQQEGNEDPGPIWVDDGYLRFDYNGLLRVNPDFKCWIDIPGTIISYPVVQASDNNYYLRRTFTGQYNVGGVIFMDCMCPADLTGRNTVIYGHRMNDGSMFTDLKKFLNASFARENDEIRLYRADGVYVYKIFAAYKSDALSDWYYPGFNSDAEFESWLRTQKGRSDVIFDMMPVAEDRIITLSTCVGSWDELGRYIVQAVLVDVVTLDD